MEFINTEDMDDGGPPIGNTEEMHMVDNHPRYPNTPEHSHIEDVPTYSNAFIMVSIAITIAHLWTIWTLRTDINIIMEYHKEYTTIHTYFDITSKYATSPMAYGARGNLTKESN